MSGSQVRDLRRPFRFMIRISDPEEEIRAIDLLMRVTGRRLILPGNRWVINRRQLEALKEADIEFEQMTPDVVED